MSERVVLVHGLGRTCGSMARLQRGLDDMGFAASCWPYPSRRRRLAGHTDAFRQWLGAQAFQGPVHFVGHSLGGLVIRGALAPNPPVSIGRIVLIATPNRGVGVVSRFVAWPFSQVIFGLPLEDLAEHSPALQNLGVPEGETGIIAGERPFHPVHFISYVNLCRRAGHTHDGTVELASTHLEGARDSIVIDAHHTFICDQPQVIEQTGAFLRDGRFLR